MKHAAWDNGAIDAAFVEVFGIGTGQKTSKTRCGKRVAMSTIDNEHPTCPQCCADIARQEKSYQRIQQYSQAVVDLGLDAANALAATWEDK